MKYDKHLRTTECNEHGCKDCAYRDRSMFKSPCCYCKRWWQDASYPLVKAKYCYWEKANG